MGHAATTMPNRFTMQAVEAMNRAYEEVCGVLKSKNADHAARVKAGDTIMHLAKQGETDERLLCDQALGAVGYLRQRPREAA